MDCYLGANTRNGFYSLYADFPPENAFLHVIKGGPGTGKSSLMKAIVKAAEERGLAAEQVFCSGDPDSLDGVYIPALGQAWADGTAPHVLEPKLLGVTGDYLNLSEYLILPFSEAEKLELLHLQEENSACYRLAYELLQNCAEKGGCRTKPIPDERSKTLLESLPQKGGRKPIRRCFISAISCKGQVTVLKEQEDCRIYPASPETILRTSERLEENGWSGILCPSPLDPEVPEALLLPEKKLCLKTVPWPTEEADRLLQEAIASLARAKQLHDRIELLYRPHMDFRALSERTKDMIQNLFS